MLLAIAAIGGIVAGYSLAVLMYETRFESPHDPQWSANFTLGACIIALAYLL